MEKIMAQFGRDVVLDDQGQPVNVDYVRANVLSENNAIKYRLSIAGSCTKSTVAPYIKFQDVAFGPQVFNSGMTVLELDLSGGVPVTLNTKQYNFTTTPSAVNRAFMTFIDSLPANRLVVMISNGKLNTDQELYNWMAVKGSVAWMEPWTVAKMDASYSAFYISGRNTIVSEHILYNDKVQSENVSTPLDIVYDKFDDIGATGYPKRTVKNLEETITNDDREAIIRLPLKEDGTADLITPLAGYNMSAGDVMLVKFSLMTSPAVSALADVRLSIRFFNGTTLVGSSFDYNARPLAEGVWQPFERNIVVPAGADGFTIYCYKTVRVLGPAGIKDFIFGEVTRQDEPLTRPAEIGVNGIRMNLAIDGKTTNLLTLVDTDMDPRGRVQSANFQEFYS